MKKVILILFVATSIFACSNEPAVSQEEQQTQDAQDKTEQEDAFKSLEEGNDSLIIQADETTE